MSTLNVADLHVLTGLCKQLGIESPRPIVRGLELLEVARQHAEPPTGPVLSLSDEAARDRIDDLSRRSHLFTHSGTGTGLAVGIESFEAQLLAEVREETMPFLEDVTTAMRPAFDAAAEPLMVAAQRFGYTWATSSDDVVDRADEEASAAWRDTRDALAAIQTPARMRIMLARMFDLSPTLDDLRRHHARQGQLDAIVTDDQLNFSVCFAAGDNWNFHGFYIEPKRGGKSMLDWLALAAGGLRLNTPDEVRQKLHARQTGIIARSPEAA